MSKNKKLNIYAMQMNPIVGDIAGNMAKIKAGYEDAITKGANVVITPELSICGYPPEDSLLRPHFIKQCTEAVKELMKTVVPDVPLLIGTPFLAGNGKLYNAVAVVNWMTFSKPYIQYICKTHLPNYGEFDEERYFTPSSTKGGLIKVKGITLGIAICADIWHTDVVTSLEASGAEAILSINASPFEIHKHLERVGVIKKRVNETNLPVLYLNQVGGQDELLFDGNSFTMNPNEKIANEQSCWQEVNFMTALEKHSGNLHFINGGSTKPIGLNESIYTGLTMGLRDYIYKNGFKSIVLGLSGGADSALAATIAVDALGAKNVHGVMMPYKYTSDISLEDARSMAENLGISYEVVPIHDVVDSLKERVSQAQGCKISKPVTIENLQARARGIILMGCSNDANGVIVLGTGNKSEMAVGYSTLYGDMCAGFNILKDVYKTKVFDLMNWRNSVDHLVGGYNTIPARIITRPPSAELGENQIDSDSLPDYPTLDSILHLMIEKHASISDVVVAGHNRQDVERVFHLFDRAEYKRRQAPPGPKITGTSFGKHDWRLPITNHYVAH